MTQLFRSPEQVTPRLQLPKQEKGWGGSLGGRISPGWWWPLTRLVVAALEQVSLSRQGPPLGERGKRPSMPSAPEAEPEMSKGRCWAWEGAAPCPTGTVAPHQQHRAASFSSADQIYLLLRHFPNQN